MTKSWQKQAEWELPSNHLLIKYLDHPHNHWESLARHVLVIVIKFAGQTFLGGSLLNTNYMTRVHYSRQKMLFSVGDWTQGFTYGREGHLLLICSPSSTGHIFCIVLCVHCAIQASPSGKWFLLFLSAHLHFLWCLYPHKWALSPTMGTHLLPGTPVNTLTGPHRLL